MKSKAHLLLILSLASLFAGCTSEGNDVESDSLNVLGKDIAFEELFSACGVKEAAGFEGIPLDCIVSYSGAVDTGNGSYVLVGSDGYQKTVGWSDLQQGVLTLEGTSVFPHLPKGFWVKGVAEVKYAGQ